MGIPLLIGGLALTGLDIARFLNERKNTELVRLENERYWSDYQKNTGVVPLYPHRAGEYFDYLGDALSVSQGVVDLYGRARRRF